MHRDMSFAGLRMSTQEWRTMEESVRLQYLQVFIETSPPRADEWAYEAYELSLDSSGN